MSLFELRGDLSRRAAIILGVLGGLFILAIWILLTSGEEPMLRPAQLPPPWRVLTAYPELYFDNNIVRNTCLSIGRNLIGYVEALAIAIPVGFLIGLYPFFKGAFQAQVDAIRYIPLTAVTVLFIAWFGVSTPMKVHFLAFGILIYLLPVVVQRIREVNEVYLKMVYTLGANDWQTIKTVYFPSVMSRVFQDIRVLTAISWTYIIVAELIGSEGGIGELIWRVGQRQGRMDKVFAMLIIIMVIGVLQDKLFEHLDRRFFPHKYQIKDQEKRGRIKEQSVIQVIWNYMLQTLKWVAIVIYVLILINEVTNVMPGWQPIAYLFGDTAWVVHLLLIILTSYTVYDRLRQIRQIAARKAS